MVRGKGDKEREVYFNIRCDIWLKRYIESWNDNNPSIFVTARQPHKMSVAQMRYITSGSPIVLKLKKTFIHRYATHLLNNGAPIEVIQSLMGHEKSETTRIYAQLSGKLQKEYYQKYLKCKRSNVLKDVALLDEYN
ncbi:tyrosine-type recombinase/integrase [Solibacillus sp. R5-41]|uniref:tyrosine-type recombinase/integrase n=1 Tax=Solibacillus sp. R5-41 TaxID=2048654 RepID=UPI00210FF775|nr:tyrosine-type recombinase/integrase [Solibacillus sp. R5-41]